MSAPTAKGTQVLRLQHRARVVNLLRTAGPMARADLAESLGLARSSMTAIVGELLDEGTLVELDSRTEVASSRGRPRVLLACNPAIQRVVGVWIDDRRARIVVADGLGKASGQGETPTRDRNPAEVIDSIIEIAKRLIRDTTGGPVSGAGVCIPGFVDGPSGVVIESSALNWSKVDLGKAISQGLGVPTAVQDTSQAITIAEAIAGEARNARSALVLDYGAQIGFGLIIDGRPYTGATGVAGAIGHIPTLESLAPCHCGRTGCIDAHMSLHAMQAVAPQTAGVALSEVDLDAVTIATESNPEAQKIIRDVVDRVAHTAMLFEALIDPEILVIAGPVVHYAALAEALETRINEIRPPERQGRTTTVRGRIGSNYRIAVMVALQQLVPDLGAK